MQIIPPVHAAGCDLVPTCYRYEYQGIASGSGGRINRRTGCDRREHAPPEETTASTTRAMHRDVACSAPYSGEGCTRARPRASIGGAAAQLGKMQSAADIKKRHAFTKT